MGSVRDRAEFCSVRWEGAVFCWAGGVSGWEGQPSSNTSLGNHLA